MQKARSFRTLAECHRRLVHAFAVAAVLGAGALQAVPAQAAGQLVLTATGKDGTFLGKPSCSVSFQVNNPTTGEVTLFSTDLLAVDAVTGKALETVSLPGVGIAGGKLAPQSVSKPWPLNLQATTCDKVAVRFKKLLCVVGGRPCAPIAVEQKGLASITAPAQ